MGNLDPLLAGIKRLANQGILLPVPSPPSIVLNAATGLSLVYNLATGQHDLTCTVNGASTSAGGQWTTALDLDLTAQGSATYSADGSYTLGGYTWTKGNSANETAHAAISSSGLNFQPGAGTYYLNYKTSSSRTLPYLWLPLSSILSLDWNTSIRIWADISADNIASQNGASAFGCDDNGSGTSVNGYVAVRGYNGSAWNAASVGCWSTTGGLDTNPTRNVTPSMTLSAANRTVVLEIPSLSALRAIAYFASNASVPPWPATTLLQLASIHTPDVSQVGSGPIQEVPTNMGIFLGATGNGSSSSVSVTYSRIRVDYKQG